MLKCAPYIKNLCSSLQSGLWKEASSNPNGPSSLPGSPIRRPRNEVKVQPPSPTRSEGTGVAVSEAEDVLCAITDGGSSTTRGHRGCSSRQQLEAVSMPTLLAQTNLKGEEVITTVVKSDMSHVLRKLRPESPDVTRAAKKLELSKNNHLGAIAKVRQAPGRGLESPTTSTSSSITSNASSSQNHISQTSGWLPPADSWDSGGGLNLPYGWEAAQDQEGKTYYVNHLNKTTTYEDPRKWIPMDPNDVPEPRTVELSRDPELGFGFVAGSEKPVIVRFVTSGGPSVNKLKPGDQILQINGEDVKLAPRDHVITLVRNCREHVSLVVCQPPLDNSSTRKSALLSAAKKAKLKSNPSRVRFAESVDINGSPSHNGLTHSQMTSSDSVVPLMPNVLKVFLENGQTKSFKYDSSTTVQDVIDSLQIKLGLGSTLHFALLVEHVKSLRRNKLTLLDPKETLCRIASRPGAHNLRCLFRVTFVPLDAYDLLRQDSVAFEYLYVQCCNDVVQERFAPELKYDVALRLAALHIHQHAVSTNGSMAKVNLKSIEKESGLERFVPASLAESMKRKELKKLLGHFLKLNTNLTAPGQKNLTALQAKLHYLKIISELPSYGAKCFSTTLSDSNAETVILISPKFGVSQINSLRNSVPQNLCDIEQVTRIDVTKEDELSQKLDIQLKDPDKENIVLSLEDRDAEELILVLCGYHKLLTERELDVIQDTAILQQQEEEQQQQALALAPSYCSKHRVTSQGWNYPAPRGEDTMDREFTADLSSQLPYHPPPEGFRMSSDSSSDADSSMTSSTTTDERSNSIDRNRNITLESNANFNNAVKQLTTFNNNLNNRINNLVPNGILKKPPRVPNSTPVHRPSPKSLEPDEKLKKHLAELDTIVEDAIKYLQEGVTTATDHEHLKPLAFNHVDSLLLADKDDNDDDSEESQQPVPRNFILNKDPLNYQPHPSPNLSGGHSKQPPPPPPLRTRPSVINSRLKPSDSSFGLHSPDNLPLGFNPQDGEVQDLLKKLKTNKHITEDALVLDPDLIDLTMIPPPMTPDEDGIYRVFPGAASAVSTPPTPFADRESLEAELKALEKDLGDIQQLKMLNGWNTTAARVPSSHISDDTLSDGSSVNSYNLSGLPSQDEIDGLAAVYQLRDIDSFIEKITVPPPPERNSHQWNEMMSTEALDDISAFIIPPPPAKNDVNEELNINNETTKIVSPDLSRVSASSAASIGGGIEKISPKIASIQQKFLGSNHNIQNDLAVNNATIGTEQQHGTQPPPTFKGLTDTLTRKKSPTAASVSDLVKQNNIAAADMGLPPPPPPPRSSIPKGMLKKSTYEFGNSGPAAAVVTQPPPARPSKLPLKPQQAQNSSEENSPVKKALSKLSLTSSSDSLSSNASITTVKSVSPNKEVTEVEEAPPSLPPRQSSPIKSPSRPPIASPEATDISITTSSPKPTLPSRASKPSAAGTTTITTAASSKSSHSPVKEAVAKLNNNRALPQVPANKAPPPPPPLSASEKVTPPPILASKSYPGSPIKSNGVIKSNGLKSNLVQQESNNEEKPQLPQKTTVGSGGPGRKLPAPPPPPPPAKTNGVHNQPQLPLPAKPRGLTGNGIPPPLRNGHGGNNSVTKLEVYTNSHFDHEEGTSVDDIDEIDEDYNSEDDRSSPPGTKLIIGSPIGESNDDDPDDKFKKASRHVIFHKAEDALNEVLIHIDKAQDLCNNAGSNTTTNKSKDQYLKSKEILTNESRQFVTASKLFVKSATESEGQLMDCLNHCVHMIDRIGKVTIDVAKHTPTPMQTQALISKVRDVADTFLQTVLAAGNAIGKDMNDPSMNVLMKKATNLASVLTTLMRSLRVFN